MYYVYVFLDPRLSGEYRYGEFSFDYEPFYVGKGRGDRWRTHLGTSASRISELKHRVAEIHAARQEPVVIRVKTDGDEQAAFIKEAALIAAIGRKDLGKGPLLNKKTERPHGEKIYPGAKKPRTQTYSLAPEIQEALRIIAEEREEPVSTTVSWLIRTEMARRGYSLVEPVQRRNNMQVEILSGEDKYKTELPIFQHNGELFLPAKKGSEYIIRLINNSGNRRLAVLSVDGVNVIDGKNAGYDGSGYVVAPWGKLEVTGFLRNDKEAAAFKFAEVGNSYAAKTGRGADNVGIIGVAIFDEQTVPNYWSTTTITSTYSPPSGGIGGVYMNSSPSGMPDSSTVSCSLPNSGTVGSESCDYTSFNPNREVKRTSHKYGGSGQSVHAGNEKQRRRARRQDVGTEYGRKVEMRTETTNFERATKSPAEVIRVRYATWEALQSWGVPVYQGVPKKPDAFPAEQPMVPAPSGWKG